MTDVDSLARVLMAAWEEAEGKSVTPSYVATFADMARAVIKSQTPEYEWGVWSSIENTIHRAGMDEATAHQWVSYWEKERPSNIESGLFKVCKRQLGDWEVDGTA